MQNINNHPNWSTKTYIIATNRLKMINYADKVIHMEKGRVEFFGSPERYKATMEYKSIVSTSSLVDQETPMLRIAEVPEREVKVNFTRKRLNFP